MKRLLTELNRNRSFGPHQKRVGLLAIDSQQKLCAFRAQLPTVLNCCYLFALVLQILNIYLGGRTFLADAIGAFISPASLIEIIDTYMTSFLLCIFLTGIFCFGISFKKLIVAIVAFLLVQYCSSVYLLPNVVWVVWLILSYPDSLNYKSVFKCFYLSNTILTLFTICACAFGLTPNIVQYDHSVPRFSLGFCSPNALGITITLTVLAWCAYKAPEWSIRKSIFALAVLSMMFIICNSRAALVYGTMFVTLLTIRLFLKKRNGLKLFEKIFYVISILVFPVCFFAAVATLIYGLTYPDTPVYRFVNHILSGRLDYIVSYYREYSIQLSGQPIPLTSAKDVYYTDIQWRGLDCAYLRGLLLDGPLFTVGIILMITAFAVCNFKRIHSFEIALTIIAMGLFCLTENILWDTSLNSILSILGVLGLALHKHIFIEETSQPRANNYSRAQKAPNPPDNRQQAQS